MDIFAAIEGNRAGQKFVNLCSDVILSPFPEWSVGLKEDHHHKPAVSHLAEIKSCTDFEFVCVEQRCVTLNIDCFSANILASSLCFIFLIISSRDYLNIFLDCRF